MVLNIVKIIEDTRPRMHRFTSQQWRTVIGHRTVFKIVAFLPMVTLSVIS